MIEFSLSPELTELRSRMAQFVDVIAIPAESRDEGKNGPNEALRAELQEQAKAAGLFAPSSPGNSVDWG